MSETVGRVTLGSRPLRLPDGPESETGRKLSRDEFAAAALPGVQMLGMMAVWTKEPGALDLNHSKRLALNAYAIADAMIAERDKAKS